MASEPLLTAEALPFLLPNMGAAFDGVVLHYPASPRPCTSTERASVRQYPREVCTRIFLTDLPSLQFCALIIPKIALSLFWIWRTKASNVPPSSLCLRGRPLPWGKILHSLMYVGGTVVTKPPFDVDPAFVLVGLEI
ncbi:hypothetical protein B0H11DRAFT_899258 [Mycena galericulata]|nr:hypothetical protein B0H11DRAFT_899258 [Mycena galericulata]